MVDLDEVLRTWFSAPAAEWDAAAGNAVAARIGAAHGITPEWEPDDEEWICLFGDAAKAMISVRYPLALATAALVGPFAAEPGITVVEVSDIDAEELRASPEVLRATVLPSPYWAEDFDPDGFSAWDLFLQSV